MTKILLLTFLGLTSCSVEKNEPSGTETQQTAIDGNEFSRYLDLLPKVSILYETNCEHCCTHLSLDDDNALVRKYRPEGAAIVGLVSRTDERAILLVTFAADMIIPSLKVYDLSGNLTGEMNFMTNYCGGEPGFYSSQFFKINTNNSFSQIDTLYEMTIDTLTYNILDTASIKITAKHFIINKAGEIIENSSDRKYPH
jgi:hypothetical protein